MCCLANVISIKKPDLWWRVPFQDPIVFRKSGYSGRRACHKNTKRTWRVCKVMGKAIRQSGTRPFVRREPIRCTLKGYCIRFDSLCAPLSRESQETVFLLYRKSQATFLPRCQKCKQGLMLIALDVRLANALVCNRSHVVSWSDHLLPHPFHPLLTCAHEKNTSNAPCGKESSRFRYL